MKDAKKLDRFITIKERVLDARRAEVLEANHAFQEANDRLLEAQRTRLQAIETLTTAQDMSAEELSPTSPSRLDRNRERATSRAGVPLRTEFVGRKKTRSLTQIATSKRSKFYANEEQRKTS